MNTSRVTFTITIGLPEMSWTQFVAIGELIEGTMDALKDRGCTAQLEATYNPN